MVRLIDADALKSVFTEKSTEAVCGAELCKAIISRIDDAPTVDAVPVIRCKDCKHWQYESCFVESEEGDAESIILDRFAFDFCSRAERKEE